MYVIVVKMPKKSRSRRYTEKREKAHPLRIQFSEVGETKTIMMFCYLDYKDISFQMMYYDHEGSVDIKIVSDLEDKDAEFQQLFFHWFRGQLERHIEDKGVNHDIIDMMIERAMEYIGLI